MLEEEIKNKIAQRYFKKYDCTEIIKRIDFAVRLGNNYLLWAEAKQQPTDIYKMLAQLLITIKADARDLTPPKFIGCFDSEKISLTPYYNILPIFNLNDFNWAQTPSNVDDKSVQTLRKTINPDQIFTFYYATHETELKNFIAENFKEGGSLLSTIIDKNNFIFVYQKWLRTVKPYINADFEKLKKNYGVYDCDFFLAELNIDDRGTTDISDDRTVNKDFYITFNAGDRPYELMRKDGLGMDVSYKFGFKGDGLDRYAEFWKLYKRPPKEEYWRYIIERKDLLVPQDVRERKGAFFTPQIWVEKSQQYIADTLGEDWQNDYYVWDCCAGTGNLLNGLNNKYHVFASTLDQQDVDVMKERIRNGANLLESHVFQFDFLNDEFWNADGSSAKLPPDLYNVISDPEKRKRLIIYINPPYAEVGDAKQITNTGKNKNGVSFTQIRDKYANLIGIATKELFAQFLIRIYKELQCGYIGCFSTLKHLQGPNFHLFRNAFNPKLDRLFLVPANTFDNVKGNFPISFQIWNCQVKESFNGISADIFDKDNTFCGHKSIIAYHGLKTLTDWIIETRKFGGNVHLGYMSNRENDFQGNNYNFIINDKKQLPNPRGTELTEHNFLYGSIFLAVKQVIKADWLNNRDQFLYPNDGWQTDPEFQTNCLIYTLFHGQNRISCKQGVNHWIPFSEMEVGAKSLFVSHFMKDFLDGKIQPTTHNNGDLFADDAAVGTRRATSLQYSDESKLVLSAGRDLWRYYHTMDAANPNASLYDIKEFFQGRNQNGKMNSSSDDPIYTSLLEKLKTALRALGEQIKPKVYEYGFLR
ncbi:MAG: hypothetical protein J6T96_06320 [Bacteroidales bacterium]|nr:hypothetical protein [Bacteroidales bacterium]MBP5502881.1 hypothetical protein [Bacteroidales bacterium]